MPCSDNDKLIYNIKELPEAFSLTSGDLLIVEDTEGTKILDYDNFIIGLDNTTFGTTVTQNATDIVALSTAVTQGSGTLSGSNVVVIETEADISAAIARTGSAQVSEIVITDNITIAGSIEIPRRIMLRVTPGALIRVDGTLILNNQPAPYGQHVFDGRNSTGKVIGTFGKGLVHAPWFGITGESGASQTFVNGTVTADHTMVAGDKVMFTSGVDGLVVGTPNIVTSVTDTTFTIEGILDGDNSWQRFYDKEFAFMKKADSNNTNTGNKEIHLDFPPGNYSFENAWTFPEEATGGGINYGNVRITGWGEQATRINFYCGDWSDGDAAIHFGGKDTSVAGIQFASSLFGFFVRLWSAGSVDVDSIRLENMGEGTKIEKLWVSGSSRRGLDIPSGTYGLEASHIHLISYGITSESRGIRCVGFYTDLANGTINASQTQTVESFGRDLTVTGANITWRNHGFSVDQPVVLGFHEGNKETANTVAAFAASNLVQDGSRSNSVDYFVHSVVDANTIKISETVGGAAVTITNPVGLPLRGMLRYMPTGIELVSGSIPMTSVAGWNLQHCDTAILAGHNSDIRRIVFYRTRNICLDILSRTDVGVTLKPSLLQNATAVEGFRVRDQRVPGNNLAGGTAGSFEYQRSRIGDTIVAAV
tara:strand:+ start:721 stop:2667 length:1947 start_codon:yes stop_codon:yes gene_type:complete